MYDCRLEARVALMTRRELRRYVGGKLLVTELTWLDDLAVVFADLIILCQLVRAVFH